MIVIGSYKFGQMMEGATVLAHNANGISVVRMVDGRIAKLFRPTPLFSSALIYPFSRRFVRAAHRLKQKHIQTVDVTAVYKVKSLNQHMVVYHPLEGMSLRQKLADETRCAKLLPPFARFLAKLHEKGVYFRGLHFGNVLVCSDALDKPEVSFGLIDIASTRFQATSLSPRQRARNFRLMLNYDEDLRSLRLIGIDKFVAIYLHSARLSPIVKQAFMHHLSQRYDCLRNIGQSLA